MQCPFCGFRESKVVDSRHTYQIQLEEEENVKSVKKDLLLMKK